MKRRKKYILRESELKEIVKEMILCELKESGNRYVSTGTNPETMSNIKDHIGLATNLAKSLSKNLVKGALKLAKIDIPYEEFIQRVQNGDDELLKWVVSALGLNTNGYVGSDYLPDLHTAKWMGGPGYGKGNNFDAREVFNPAQAARYLLTKATPRYIRGRNGYCAKYVKAALNAGGLTAPWGMGFDAQSAKGYLKILPANGWERISPGQAGQVGDIVVIDAFPGHKHGHIAMCCGGGQWVADYRHSPGNVYGLANTPPPDKVAFFRYKNMAQ